MTTEKDGHEEYRAQIELLWAVVYAARVMVAAQQRGESTWAGYRKLTKALDVLARHKSSCQN